MCNNVLYSLLDHCDHQTTSTFGFSWSWFGRLSTKISSERICPIFFASGNTLSNHTNTLLAKREAILFTNPACVSDSWTIIFFCRRAAANTTGKATYPHLHKTTSTRYNNIYPNDWKKPITKRKMSRRFFSLDCQMVSLRYFPDMIGKKITSGVVSLNWAATWLSRLFADQNRYIFFTCCAYWGFFWIHSMTLFIGKTWPHVHHQAIAIVIFFVDLVGLVIIVNTKNF